jgi:hypothetical protein
MRTIAVEEGQTLVNIAVQKLGNADGLTAICLLNDLEFDADLTAGTVLQLPDVLINDVAAADIVNYFEDKAIVVNSHLTAEALELLATNDDEPLDIII